MANISWVPAANSKTPSHVDITSQALIRAQHDKFVSKDKNESWFSELHYLRRENHETKEVWKERSK